MSDYLNFGYHEIVVETPEHEKDISSCSNKHYEQVLNLFQKRITCILSKPGIEMVLLFKNYGKNAGASIYHAHSQIVGMGSVPQKIMAELVERENYFSVKKSCKTCFDLKDKKLNVFQSKCFIVRVPRQSRVSYELEIIPKRHVSGYQAFNKDEFRDLAGVIKSSLLLLNNRLNNFDYNMLFSISLKNEKYRKSNHFQINLIPRVSLLGGFELATGLYLNSIFPQQAAESLRSIYLKQKVA